MFENQEKVPFAIASEVSYFYIFNGQKFIKIAKNGRVWRVKNETYREFSNTVVSPVMLANLYSQRSIKKFSSSRINATAFLLTGQKVSLLSLVPEPPKNL